ncbi:prolyl oligopeptidase family serine peptidase [Vibrio palustris]|uniref:Prolyl oligopeptidase family protein n=1 Tax=Vibrio palustris TaxID=1918946 RepID=A0A1R4B5D0_9VIBR|nr:prolyl oligopeptidase family serine peptidase [Vibrio palustris]SJL84132.1 Prolyl oligopeptidase family protein [Vibrio palustris]
MLKSFLTVALSVACVSPAFAGWQANQYHDNKFTLPYQLYSPSQSGRLPLIIHLHGTGEAGTDNQAQMYKNTGWGPQYFASKTNQSIQAAYVLAPQTPGPMRWASTTLAAYNFKQTPSTPSMTALLHLIDNLIKTNSHIDRNRIYITGLSRGGQGVWNAMMQRPKLFAAAVPIAGSADPKQASTINHIPTWVFHGSADEVTSVDYSRQMVDAIIRSGGSTSTIRYTEIEGGDHASSWKAAYSNDGVYRWLMKHHK